MIGNSTGRYLWIIFNYANAKEDLVANLEAGWQGTASYIGVVRTYMTMIPSTVTGHISGVVVCWDGDPTMRVGGINQKSAIESTPEFCRICMYEMATLRSNGDPNFSISHPLTGLNELLFWLEYSDGSPFTLTAADSAFELGVLVYIY
jgi:hypothetical protein